MTRDELARKLSGPGMNDTRYATDEAVKLQSDWNVANPNEQLGIIGEGRPSWMQRTGTWNAPGQPYDPNYTKYGGQQPPIQNAYSPNNQPQVSTGFQGNPQIGLGGGGPNPSIPTPNQLNPVPTPALTQQSRSNNPINQNVPNPSQTINPIQQQQQPNKINVGPSNKFNRTRNRSIFANPSMRIRFGQ